MSQPLLPTLSSPADQTFPTLTPAQIARIEEHGTLRPIRSGEVLVEAGDHEVPFYVVKEGRLNVVRPGEATETLVATHGPGQFTGEVNMLSGRRALLRTRVAESGEVIRLDRECLLGLVQVD
ncbi:MAG TPA: cyclic nucleotide-binding domain-containing protein, partial [Thermoanaerobaculia bacterium]